MGLSPTTVTKYKGFHEMIKTIMSILTLLTTFVFFLLALNYGQVEPILSGIMLVLAVIMGISYILVSSTD